MSEIEELIKIETQHGSKIEGLTKEVAGLTAKIAVLVEKITASSLANDRRDEEFAALREKYQELSSDVAVLKSRQGGMYDLLWRIVLPAAIVASGVLYYIK